MRFVLLLLAITAFVGFFYLIGVWYVGILPILFLLVLLGFLTVIISLFSPAWAAYTGWLSAKGLWVLDAVAGQVSQLPYAQLDRWSGQEAGWAILGGQLFIAILLILLPRIVVGVRLQYRRHLSALSSQNVHNMKTQLTKHTAVVQADLPPGDVFVRP